ncbi:MAG: hypothetical protein EXQ91_09145 [Alphaproteobacteria bacterium]|nr:hypothetical protein [Alphaproteobacteria bacterium]
MINNHFTDNGFDPLDHAIINAVVAEDNRPVLFTMSPERTGANVAFQSQAQRLQLAHRIAQAGLEKKAALSLVLDGTMTLSVPMTGTGVRGDLAFSSTITIADVIGTLDIVDYLEIDIQSSEALALPPAMRMIDRKVRWLHLGAHGGQLHDEIRFMFRDHGWEINVDLKPESRFAYPGGEFEIQDGVLSLYNPR